MAIFGKITLFLAWIFSLYSFLALLFGNIKRDSRFIVSGVNAYLFTSAYILLASLLLLYSLITLDFSIEYVAMQTTRSMPVFYRIAGFWAGMDGSMLFWNLVFGMYTVVFILKSIKDSRWFYSWSFLFLSMTYLFFITVLVFYSNPFKELPQPPMDGRGLNPLLMNWWMHIHPLSLYAGYTGLSVPFSIVLGAIIAGAGYRKWVRDLRLWTIIPWLFLTLGIYFGGRWAYLELGWGGYWAWDPVENASLIPWFTAVALIHSIIMLEKRGIFKTWIAVLSTLTFILVLLGTYITRSGSLVSVHSFAQSNLGPIFLGFILFVILLSTAILIWYRKALYSPTMITTLFSREGFFLLNNWIMILLAFVVAFGTLFPRLSAFFTPTEIMVGPAFYNAVTSPLFVLMVLLMALAPYMPYRTFTRKYLKPILIPAIFSTLLTIPTYLWTGHIMSAIALWGVYQILFSMFYELISRKRILHAIVQDRRRYGGLMVHLGIAITVMGITLNTLFKEKRELIMEKGQTVSFAGYKLKYVDVESGMHPDYKFDRFTFLIKEPSGREIHSHPELRLYHKWNMKTPEIDIITSLKGDFYVAPGELEEDTGRLFLVMFFEPFIQIVWLGPLFVLLGSLFALTSGRKKQWT